MESSGVKSVYAVVAISILVYNIGIFWTLFTLIVGGVFIGVSGFFNKPRVRPVIKDGYWGKGSKKDDDETIKDFKVNVNYILYLFNNWIRLIIQSKVNSFMYLFKP